MSIVITGGAGYIGSHTIVALKDYPGEITVIDNFCNSSRKVINKVSEITGRVVNLIDGDILDKDILREIFEKKSPKSIIHFAGLKSVSESSLKPLEYYRSNVAGTLNLLDCMTEFNVEKFIFSSSATVYGVPEYIPLDEKAKTGGTTNPYGTSKFFCEMILKDYAAACPDKVLINLRYFNPVGAHISGDIGEHPVGIPNNLVPYLYQVALGKLPILKVFGSDYPTPDGTGVRDYIHVMDLAEGHVAALQNCKLPGFHCYNLGTGKGYSVSEIIQAFEDITGQKVNFEFVDRRIGDIAECWADPGKAFKELSWEAKFGLYEMLKDGWNWQCKNPDGYTE